MDANQLECCWVGRCKEPQARLREKIEIRGQLGKQRPATSEERPCDGADPDLGQELGLMLKTDIRLHGRRLEWGRGQRRNRLTPPPP